jgi:VWFA-related protein
LTRRYFNLSLVCLFCGLTFAQEPAFHSQTNTVLAPALVRDEKGHAVYGLQAKDFVVEDDGVAQTVSLDEPAHAQPISLVVAIQRGGRASYEFSRMRGLSTMLEPILSGGNVEVALIEFDSGVDLVQDFTHDAGRIEHELEKLETGDGGAAILDAVFLSEGLLRDRPRENQKMLLLISETRDHGSIAKIDGVVGAVGTSSTLVYALAFSPAASNVMDTIRGNNIDEMHAAPDLLAVLKLAREGLRKNVPESIASMTGGEYALFETRQGFETRMNEFDNHLRSRYLLSFAPKDPHPGLHAIRVQLKNGGKETVLARTSYWAGPPPE